MSHQAIIDYQGIAITCQSVCEVAESQLKEMDEMIRKLDSASTSLQNEETESLKKSISKDRERLLRQIESVRNQALQNASRGRVRGGNYELYDAHQVTRDANSLKALAQNLAAARMVEYRGLMQALLSDAIRKNNEDLHSGATTMDAETKRYIDSIEDENLRQFARIAYLEDPSLRGDALLSAAEKLVGRTYEERLEEERERIRKELEASRVDPSKIKEVTESKGGSAKETIAAMQAAASDEIIDEKVRKKSLRIIMSAIKARGFLVDEKNIKLNRETNEVNMVALKASGEKAEFKVYLDGRFVYHFRGYEGQACQKDIDPFMKDLEEVYGLKINNVEELWRNPDKIGTMKYQALNTNKNKG